MLPKQVYSKIVQALKKMKVAWEEDRAEDPKRAPYEIDISLKNVIEREMREGRMSMNNADRNRLVAETFEYLVKQRIIVGSPYGGHFFPLPDGVVIPTKDELTTQTKKATNENFFGKPKDFTDE